MVLSLEQGSYYTTKAEHPTSCRLLLQGSSCVIRCPLLALPSAHHIFILLELQPCFMMATLGIGTRVSKIFHVPILLSRLTISSRGIENAEEIVEIPARYEGTVVGFENAGAQCVFDDGDRLLLEARAKQRPHDVSAEHASSDSRRPSQDAEAEECRQAHVFQNGGERTREDEQYRGVTATAGLWYAFWYSKESKCVCLRPAVVNAVNIDKGF